MALPIPVQIQRSRRGWAPALTPVAFLMVTPDALDALDALVAITALPAIHRDLGGSLPTLEWTVNAYTLACAAGIITAAALGDRFGRRRVLTIGLVLFSAASAACVLSPTADLGKASGANSTFQRFGSAFGIAVVSAVFAANGRLSTPASLDAGFRPGLTVAAGFSVLGVLTTLAVGGRRQVAASILPEATAPASLDQRAVGAPQTIGR